MTNYEKIKAMSVEELADLLCNCADCGNGRCYGEEFCRPTGEPANGRVKYLLQEAEE
jgi:hypothetical protein